MAQVDYRESADFIQNNLRLKTFPVAVKFLKDKSTFSEKTRQPSIVLGKRVTICQGVTMARTYGWTVCKGSLVLYKHVKRFQLYWLLIDTKASLIYKLLRL